MQLHLKLLARNFFRTATVSMRHHAPKFLVNSRIVSVAESDVLGLGHAGFRLPRSTPAFGANCHVLRSFRKCLPIRLSAALVYLSVTSFRLGVMRQFRLSLFLMRLHRRAKSSFRAELKSVALPEDRYGVHSANGGGEVARQAGAPLITQSQELIPFTLRSDRFEGAPNRSSLF